jgi:uncharacterized protein YndB with AHSA1/START domain
MPTYSVSIDIAAPPEEVYALVSDLTRHPEWAADPIEVTPVGDGPVAVGKEYRTKAVSRGKTITAELKVTEMTPPTRFAFSVRDLTGDYLHEFRVVPRGPGTHVERNVTATLGLKQRALFMVVFRPIKLPNTQAAMTRLKERLEARTA